LERRPRETQRAPRHGDEKRRCNQAASTGGGEAGPFHVFEEQSREAPAEGSAEEQADGFRVGGIADHGGETRDLRRETRKNPALFRPELSGLGFQVPAFPV